MRVRRTHDIGNQLSAYSASTRAVATRRCPSTAVQGWAVYTAAAGAALTMAPAAEAIPIYSGPQDLLLIRGNSVGLDLDGNGVIDFTATLRYNYPLFREVSPENAFSATDLGIGSYVMKNLTVGAMISGGYYRPRADNVEVRRYLTYNCPGTISVQTSCRGFHPSRIGFAGVRFTHAGQDLFGWIRLHLQDDFSGNVTALLIKDWAYENQPGVGIRAGEGLPAVPEPNGLALLATGAAGIAAWRRRRRQKARQDPTSRRVR